MNEYSKLRDCLLWNQKRRFSKFEAWMDLMMQASSHNEVVLYHDQSVRLKPGQLVTSEIKLAKDWGWSREKVRRFLDTTRQGTCEKRDKRYTLITLLDYETYAKGKKGNETRDKTTDETREKAEFDAEFSEFWDAYDYKVNKHDAINAYRTLKRKGVSKERIAMALNGYHDFLKYRKINDNFDQHKMYPTTFLRQGRWEQFENYEYKARL